MLMTVTNISLRSSSLCFGFHHAKRTATTRTGRNLVRVERVERFERVSRHNSLLHNLARGDTVDDHSDYNDKDKGDTATTSTTMITSKASTTIKRVRSLLTSRKKRLQSGSTVVEGPRSVLDLLRAKPSLVQQVLLRSTASGDTNSSEDDNTTLLWKILQDLPTATAPQIFTVEASIFDSLADTVTPQGMMAVVRIPDHHFDNDDDDDDDDDDDGVDDLKSIKSSQFSSSSPSPSSLSIPSSSSPLVLILDGVADPGNVGTLLRSAVATGVSAVLTLPGTNDPYSPKALRSSMACVFSIPMVQACTSWDEALSLLQSWDSDSSSSSNSSTSDTSNTPNSKVRIYAATMMDDLPGTCHYDIEWSQQHSIISCIIIGNEGVGLSEPVRKAVQDGIIQSVYVPMVPNSVESLNAGVCGSVIMFECLRQVQTKQAKADKSKDQQFQRQEQQQQQ